MRLGAARLVGVADALSQWFWLRRAVTLGVRAIVIADASIFLVRHTYRSGWYLPGGAVDRGESAAAAATRELLEEGGLRALERPRLHHFYRNGRHDHVACYIFHAFEREPSWTPDWEIAEARFFPLADLPPETTRATRDRVAEVVEGRKPADDW